MLWTLIRQTQWKPFVDLMSPSFFQVVPAGPLVAELRRFVALSRSAPEFERAVAHRRSSLERAGLPIRLATSAAPNRSASTNAALRGQRVLELYFHQVFSDGLTLLDLRRARFQEEGEGLVWAPSGALAEWSPAFRSAVQALYRGFYGDDDALLREGLASLGLSRAEREIRSQFGEGQQRAVRFSLKDFQQKFHDVFVRCQATGSRIDIGFVPLGLCLATLYEHLEALGEPFDARAAFEASQRKRV